MSLLLLPQNICLEKETKNRKNQKIKNQKIKNKNNDRINISLWRSSHTPPLLVKRGINITGQIMKLILIRRYKNADYIRGELYIENPECKICDTLENAAIHAPAGEYDLSYASNSVVNCQSCATLIARTVSFLVSQIKTRHCQGFAQ